MLNIQNGVRLDRLQCLADYLESKVTDDHFNMGWWSNGPDPTAKDFCGCAGGHATALFREDGFNLYDLQFGSIIMNRRGPTPKDCFYNLTCFFGLDRSDTGYLFGLHSRTRLEEVQIIREFIAKQETTP